MDMEGAGERVTVVVNKKSRKVYYASSRTRARYWEQVYVRGGDQAGAGTVRRSRGQVGGRNNNEVGKKVN
jgi:hypothetical protein